MGRNTKGLKVAVAGTGYVGLSNAVLLAQHNAVYAVDLVPEKVELLNNKYQSPILSNPVRYFIQHCLMVSICHN